MPKKRSKEKEKRSVRFSDEQLNLCCEWKQCEITFDSMRSFVWHVVEHQIADLKNDTELNCQWRGCNFTAETGPQLNVHVNFHAFHAKIKCIGANLIDRKKLEGCNRSDGRNLIPELPNEFICGWENCQLSFNNPELFYRHCDAHCDDTLTDLYSCQWDSCQWNFKEARRLREHIRTHTQERMIACPTCGSVFSNRTKFHDHLKRQTPTEEHKYRCSHCFKIFSSERFLRDHMRIHINNYKCFCCDMTCSTPSSLRNHVIYRHTDERLFSCNFCNYSGKTQLDVNRHLKTHLTQKVFECKHDGCKFTTNSKYKLTMHTRRKHEENGENISYNCHLCDKKVKRGAYLTRHLVSKHNFQWPSGHSRFRYKRNSDGNYQLQTVRYESIELTQEMIDRDEEFELVVDEGESDGPDSTSNIDAALDD